ncbi:MAG: MGMT family protein [Muribaculaceae bacterium]|nr:MGMT family protein [Muribaculaceae bacterium]
MLEIPRGETRTYAQIARLMGNPTAVRAVANAIAANPVAVIVPCHRVVRSDGTAGGYRWGSRLKTRLLDLEKEVSLSTYVIPSN